MNANEYQSRTALTAVYPGIGGGTPTPEQLLRYVEHAGLLYVVLGLNGEAGEAAEVVKKGIRDGNLDLVKLKKELGDVAWYLARASAEAGFTLDEVFEANLEKLADRKDRGVIGGSGNDR